MLAMKRDYFKSKDFGFNLQEKIESLNSTSENQVVFEEVEKEYSSYETFLWSLTVSIFNVGGMLGSYLTGFFIGKLGRYKLFLGFFQFLKMKKNPKH